MRTRVPGLPLILLMMKMDLRSRMYFNFISAAAIAFRNSSLTEVAAAEENEVAA